MGVAAYNRGSKAIRESIAQDFPSHEARSLPGSVNHPTPEPTQKSEDRFSIGDTVYCKVRGVVGFGWPEKVTDIKKGSCFRNDKIKTTGSRMWCPAYNFQRTSPI